MHDAKNQPLAVGDVVLVPFKIVSLGVSEDWCNVGLESLANMAPYGDKTRLHVVNTKQTIRANVGDDTHFEIEKKEVDLPEGLKKTIEVLK